MSEKDKKDVVSKDERIIAIMSYIWILFLIPLLAKKDSKFCQFHAKQGMVLFIGSLFTWFPVIGWILSVAILIISVIGIIKTYHEEWWKIPYIHDWSKKIKL